MPRYHGAHCRLRSFPTKCPRCGVAVLYWQCTHGCKIFFNYPAYGKPQRHICQPIIRKRRNPVIISLGEHRRQQTERTTFRCPVCQKLFEEQGGLERHIRQMKKTDDPHAYFFGEVLDLINFDRDEEEAMDQTKNLQESEEVFEFPNEREEVGQYRTKLDLLPTESKKITKKSRKKTT
jgi:predicted RNA-binding Zn-ribbon protein involved in translation (DUF1610 family)